MDQAHFFHEVHEFPPVSAVTEAGSRLKAFGLLKSRRSIFCSIADTRNVKLLKGRFGQILEQPQ
jgi:hypothetical protein